MPMNFATQQLNSLTLVKVFPRATICVPYGDDVEIGLLPAGKTPLEIITGSMTNRYTDLLRRVSPEPNEVAFLHRLQIGWMTLPNNIFGGTVVQINGKMILVHKGLIENRKACQSWKSWTSSCTRLEEGLCKFIVTRQRRSGKDFIVVFQSNPILSSYIHIEGCSKD